MANIIISDLTTPVQFLIKQLIFTIFHCKQTAYFEGPDSPYYQSDCFQVKTTQMPQHGSRVLWFVLINALDPCISKFIRGIRSI